MDKSLPNDIEIEKITSVLRRFLMNSSADDLSDVLLFWDKYCFLNTNNCKPCWELKNCAAIDCSFYGKSNMHKCWLDDSTACCNLSPDFSAKIKQCLECEVMSQCKSHPHQEFYEVLSLFIKFVKSRETYLFDTAVKDSLTGVYNRTYFEDYIKHQLQLATRYKESMSVILLDFNKFKEINDTYGHDAGDFVLKTTIDLIRASVRKSDLIFRFGGDEFLIFLPRTDCDVVEVMKDKITEELVCYNKDIQKFYPGIHVSISMGCSTWREGQDIHEKIKEADSEMYSCKRT